MKNKIILMVSILVCMLSMCSCEKQVDEAELMLDAQLQMACEQAAGTLADMSPEEISYYQSYYASQENGEIYTDLMTKWFEIQPQVGKYVELKDFSVEKTGKTISAVQVISFEKRDVKLTYVLNANTKEVTAINVDMVYSLGEIMSKAGLNTVMGIGIVFLILILICLIIYCFSIIPVIQDKLSKNKKDMKIEVAEKTVVTPVQIQKGTDDLELIAVISAAIAAQTGASTDDFVVRSIKRRY